MKNNSSSGLGLSSVLTIVFIVLKLTKVIDWSWLWVLSPLWIDLILIILLIAGVYIYTVYEETKHEREYGTSLRKRNVKKDKWKF